MLSPQPPAAVDTGTEGHVSMTNATITQASLAASPAIAREPTHQPNRLTCLIAASVASGRAIGGFVISVIRAPILPVEPLLEAGVLASMLDSHAVRDQVRSDRKTPYCQWPL
jgi:hypothetical protein